MIHRPIALIRRTQFKFKFITIISATKQIKISLQQISQARKPRDS